MDIRMPLVDGIAATARIMASFPLARIIMVTEFTNDGLREAARKAGAEHYVLKEDLSPLRQLICEPAESP
jgi:DNA-binding NarL/FixJ family response regulator